MPTEENSLMSGARFVAQHLTAPERIERAIREIEANLKNDPGVVYDHAKSLIETTCKTIFKELGQNADEGWKLQQLASYTLSAVIRIPEGHPDPAKAQQRIGTALKSLVGVVHGLGELRNLEGEIGHGQASDRVTLSSFHAEFAARAADTVVKFLVDAHRSGQKADGAQVFTSYFERPDFNAYIDELHEPISIFNGSYNASEILFQLDPQIYKDALDEFINEKTEEGAP